MAYSLSELTYMAAASGFGNPGAAAAYYQKNGKWPDKSFSGAPVQPTSPPPPNTGIVEAQPTDYDRNQGMLAIKQVMDAEGVSAEQAVAILTRAGNTRPSDGKTSIDLLTGLPLGATFKTGFDWETLDEQRRAALIREQQARDELNYQKGVSTGQVDGKNTLDSVKYVNEILANPQNAALAEMTRKGFALGPQSGETVAQYLNRSLEGQNAGQPGSTQTPPPSADGSQPPAPSSQPPPAIIPQQPAGRLNGGMVPVPGYAKGGLAKLADVSRSLGSDAERMQFWDKMRQIDQMGRSLGAMPRGSDRFTRSQRVLGDDGALVDGSFPNMGALSDREGGGEAIRRLLEFSTRSPLFPDTFNFEPPMTVVEQIAANKSSTTPPREVKTDTKGTALDESQIYGDGKDKYSLIPQGEYQHEFNGQFYTSKGAKNQQALLSGVKGVGGFLKSIVTPKMGRSVTPHSDAEYFPENFQQRAHGGPVPTQNGAILGGEPHFIVNSSGQPKAALTEDGKPEAVIGKQSGVEVIPLDPARRAAYELRKAQSGQPNSTAGIGNLPQLAAGGKVKFGKSARTAASRRPGASAGNNNRNQSGNRAKLSDGSSVKRSKTVSDGRASNGRNQGRGEEVSQSRARSRSRNPSDRDAQNVRRPVNDVAGRVADRIAANPVGMPDKAKVTPGASYATSILNPRVMPPTTVPPGLAAKTPEWFDKLPSQAAPKQYAPQPVPVARPIPAPPVGGLPWSPTPAPVGYPQPISPVMYPKPQPVGVTSPQPYEKGLPFVPGLAYGGFTGTSAPPPILIGSGGDRTIGNNIAGARFGFDKDALSSIAGANQRIAIPNLPGVGVLAAHKIAPRTMRKMTPADRAAFESMIRASGQDVASYYAQAAYAEPGSTNTGRSFV